MTSTSLLNKSITISHYLAHGYIHGVTLTLRHKYFIIANDIISQITNKQRNYPLTFVEVINLIAQSVGKPDIINEPIYDIILIELNLLPEAS